MSQQISEHVSGQTTVVPTAATNVSRPSRSCQKKLRSDLRSTRGKSPADRAFWAVFGCGVRAVPPDLANFSASFEKFNSRHFHCGTLVFTSRTVTLLVAVVAVLSQLLKRTTHSFCWQINLSLFSFPLQFYPFLV